MKRTLATWFLLPLLAFGAVACSDQEQKDAGDTASQAVEDAGEAAGDAAQEVEDALADVQWDQYAENTQKKIDDWAAEDNCSGLNDFVEELDPDQDGELITYVKAKIEEAGCA